MLFSEILNLNIFNIILNRLFVFKKLMLYPSRLLMAAKQDHLKPSKLSTAKVGQGLVILLYDAILSPVVAKWSILRMLHMSVYQVNSFATNWSNSP